MVGAMATIGAHLPAFDQRSLDTARFWRLSRFHALEGLSATFRRHSYARHSHDTYAVGAIIDGCETFYHRGVQHYASAGHIAVVGPDEFHDGAPYGDRYAYRMIYPSVELMLEAAEDALGRPSRHLPWFKGTVMADKALVALLVQAHRALETATDQMRQDELLLAFLTQLIVRHGDVGPPRIGAVAPIDVARDFLDAHFADDVGLAELAGVAGLSRTELVRGFRQATGATPHAYLVDRRFRAARRRLMKGELPAEVAAACGFCDQSHLNRVFKARMGVTPGAYRAG